MRENKAVRCCWFQNSRSKYFYASLYAICTRIPRDFTFLLFFCNLTSSIDQIFNFRCENAANSKIVAEIGEEMKAVEIYMSDIQDISHKFDFITKNGSEKQIFRLIKTLETGLCRKSEDLEKLYINMFTI
jgi:hypothetical protein